jgi:predicted CopG family antitoxin
MKLLLKELYHKNRRDFDVWNYLWLFSDESNSIQFSHTDLGCRFKVPLSSLHRMLNKYPEIWNIDKTFVEYEKTGYKSYKVIFYPKGKKEIKAKTITIHDELFNWLKEFYKEKNFDYSDLTKHKRYVKTICGKVEKAMENRDTQVTDESLSDTFKLIFENLPEWWVDSGNITLTTISKNFTKILNQIKANNGATKKDSYSKAAESVTRIDYDDLASNK